MGVFPRGDQHSLRKSVDRKAQNQQHGVRVLPTGLIYLCFVISRFSQLFITSRSLRLNLLSISTSFGIKNNLCWRWEMRNLFCWSHTQTLTASEAINTRTSVTSDGVGTCGVGMTTVSAFFTLSHIWRNNKKKCSYIRQLVTEKKASKKL